MKITYKHLAQLIAENTLEREGKKFISYGLVDDLMEIVDEQKKDFLSDCESLRP